MSEITASDDFREFLLDLLPKSQHGKVPAIVTEFERYTSQCAGFYVDGARGGVETVHAYGLEITIDANGRAEHVDSAEWFTPVWQPREDESR